MKGFQLPTGSLLQVTFIFCLCCSYYVSTTSGLFWSVAEAAKLPDSHEFKFPLRTLNVQKKPSLTSLYDESFMSTKTKVSVRSPNSHLYSRIATTDQLQSRDDSNSPTTDQISLTGGMNTAAYFVDIEVGTPSQPFRLDVDTGSSMMIIVGKGCVINNTNNACGHVKGDSGYNERSSSTSRNVTCDEEPECLCMHNQCYFAARYGDNSQASGWVVNDIVQLGDFSVPAYFTNIKVQQGINPTSSLTDERMDGILGLSFRDLDQNFPGVFDMIVQNYTEVKDIFSMCFGAENGLLFLGGYNESHFNDSIQYTPITEELYYSIQLSSIVVEGQTITYPTNYDTIVDSGTTGLYLPQDVHSSVLAALQGRCQEANPPRLLCAEQNIFTIQSGECLYLDENELSELPSLEFMFPSETDSSTLFNATIAGRDYIEYFTTDSIKWDYCGMLMILPSPYGQTILGDSFMRGLYTVFDRENKRIGFAKPNNCGNELSPKKHFPVLIVVLLGVCGLFLLIMVGAMIRCCLQRRKKRLNRRYLEESASLLPTTVYRNERMKVIQ